MASPKRNKAEIIKGRDCEKYLATRTNWMKKIETCERKETAVGLVRANSAELECKRWTDYTQREGRNPKDNKSNT